MKLNKKTGFRQCLFATVYCLVATPAFAEQLGAGLDQISPIFIQSPKVMPATANHPLTITAYVTDNVGVRSVTLYFRFGRIAPYFQLSENRAYKKLDLGLTPEGDYRAEISRDQVAGNVLEYYVEVSDTAGNTASKGLPGQPFIVTFVDSQVSSNLARLTNPENPGQPALIPAQEQRVSGLVKTPPKEDSEDDKVIAWYQQRWVWAVAGGVVLAAALGGGGGGNSSPTGSVTVIAPPTQ